MTSQARVPPPGSMGLPLLGETLDFVRDPLEFDASRRRRLDKEVYSTHVLFAPAVRVGPRDNAAVLKSELKGQSRVSWPSTWAELMGKDALTVVTGDAHVKLRKLLGRAVTPEATRTYVGAVDECVVEMLRRFAAETKHRRMWGDAPLPSERFKRLTLEIFVRTAFGGGPPVPDDEITRMSELFSTWIAGFQALWPWALPFNAIGRALRARDELYAMLDSLVERHRAARPDDDESFLGRVLHAVDDDGKHLSSDQLRSNLLTMLFAGHDTTYVTFSTLVGVLYDEANRDVLRNLREEVRREFPSAASGKPLDFDALKNAPYLNAIANELWRAYAPVGGGFREALVDIELGDPRYHIPKGWKAYYSIFAGHYDETFWGANARAFDVDRFRAKSASPELARYFLPFGGGNRVCLGEALARLELRVFLARVAEYDFEIISRERIYFPFNVIRSEFWVSERGEDA